MKKGDSTSGIVRDKAFEGDEIVFARPMIAGGVKSGGITMAHATSTDFSLLGDSELITGSTGARQSRSIQVTFFTYPSALSTPT